MAKQATTIKPGQRVPDSGIYENTRTRERVTLVRDKIVPPTSHPNERYREVVNTNPNNDRKK